MTLRKIANSSSTWRLNKKSSDSRRALKPKLRPNRTKRPQSIELGKPALPKNVRAASTSNSNNNNNSKREEAKHQEMKNAPHVNEPNSNKRPARLRQLLAAIIKARAILIATQPCKKRCKLLNSKCGLKLSGQLNKL